ncbi:LOW QUALITY PROTEIN: platelet-derived growth factor receptor beta-like [Narcine bancroftii]|uniref:LOW QUALITY PROTEIN: platelet-derived growth factor receptor beta-like n=1 Tax=Narcine bancroftii TaxID=1343680 RepID=UPI003831CAD0
MRSRELRASWSSKPASRMLAIHWDHLFVGLLFTCSFADHFGGHLEFREIILEPSSNITLNCLASGPIDWFYDGEPNVHIEGNSLHIVNATSYHNREYICSSNGSDILSFYVFVPVLKEWFRPQTQQEMIIMAEESAEFTIPCMVTNPKLQVTLHHMETDTIVNSAYDTRQGFLGRFEAGTYTCKARMQGEERESDEYLVEKFTASDNLEVRLHAARTVVKKGESIIITCSVNIKLLDFNWTFPRLEGALTWVSEGAEEVNSTLMLKEAKLEDSGWYKCSVQGYYPSQSEEKTLHVTVLAKGFVELKTDLTDVEYADLSEVKMFVVNVTAYPAPTIKWLKNKVPFNERTNQVTLGHKSLGENRYQYVLNLIRVKEEDFGNYSIQVSNEDEEVEFTFTLSVNVPAKILDLSDYLHSSGLQTVTCISEGSPLPEISWYTCENLKRCNSENGKWSPLKVNASGIWVERRVLELQDNQVFRVQSVVTQDNAVGIAAVRCSANNGFGNVSREIKLVSAGLHSQLVTVATILVLLVIVVISLVVLMLVWRKKPRYEIRWKVIESVSLDGHEYIYVDPTQLPYDSSWEFPRSQLSLGRTLGSGAFGRVVEATAQGLSHSDSMMKVAVKMLKSESAFSPTPSVQPACWEGKGWRSSFPASWPPWPLGPDFQAVQESDDGYMEMSVDDQVNYTPMLLPRAPPSYAQLAHFRLTNGPYLQENVPPEEQEESEDKLLISESPILTFIDLVGISYQVAHGMEFLSLRNCVHRDLAARNVLICEGKLAKICDFGLARDIVNDSNYISRGSVSITILASEWMAPESIFNNLYTTLSDVWSYGVLLWEIFTLGGPPYPELPVNDQFYNAIRHGYRMPKPHYATDEIYTIMKKCWNDEFEKRPSFSTLVMSRGNLLTETYKKKYAQASQEFMKSDHPALGRTRPNTYQASDDIIYSNCLHPEVTDNGYIIPLPDPEPSQDPGDAAEEPSSEMAVGTRPSSLVCAENEEVTDSGDHPQENEEPRTPEADRDTEESLPEVEDSFL